MNHDCLRPSPDRHRMSALCGLTIIAACTTAVQAEPELSPERAANLLRVETAHVERRSRASDDLFVRRGVVADRVARKVTLEAEATGLEGGGIVEFPIIAENSGHGYEALFVAFAKPSDVSAAIEFIGVPRGRPARPSDLSFWPKGERVEVSVAREGEPLRRLEELILDVRAKGSPALPGTGFIHAGSLRLERDGLPFFAADGDGPGSIASSYNEPTTVLDLPHQAQQGEVYERFVANPETLFRKGEFASIEISPEPRPDGHPLRVVDLTLAVSAPAGALEVSAVTLRILEAGQSPDSARALPVADALRVCRGYLPERDPYATLDWNDSISLRAATDLARVFHALDNADGLRMEAPRPGQLYYKAFLPHDAWRVRADRPTQPCELRFTRAEGSDAATATLVRIEEIWGENPENWRPDLKVREISLSGPASLPEALAATEVTLPVLLVFAPGDLTLGELMPYTRAVQTTHPNLHVFVED